MLITNFYGLCFYNQIINAMCFLYSIKIKQNLLENILNKLKNESFN